jgi:integrase
VAHLTGLFQRGTAYYIRIVLPQDHPLKTRYRNGRFVQSLGACSYREAVHRGMLKRAEVLCDFASPAASPAVVEATTSTFHVPHKALAPELRPLTTLREVYERWRVSKVRSKDSESACLRAVGLMEECLGQADLRSLTRAQGDEFRAWLLTKGATSKTSRDRFTWVKSLLKYAVRDLELLPKSPWEGLDIAHKTTARRRPWMPDELSMLFRQHLFTRYELPHDTKAGADAAYWVPLLGIFTGARISELAQLRVSDIQMSGSVPMLSITDEGEGQHVKTEAGIRTLPVHPELIRLGLFDYVDTVRQTGAVSLWPALKLREGRPGGYLSAWFGKFRKAAGITEKYPDFHCFRHTVRTVMARASVSAEVQDAITGHERQGSTGTRVYRHVDECELVKAVVSVQYPGLDLPRAYMTRLA